MREQPNIDLKAKLWRLTLPLVLLLFLAVLLLPALGIALFVLFWLGVGMAVGAMMLLFWQRRRKGF